MRRVADPLARWTAAWWPTVLIVGALLALSGCGSGAKDPPGLVISGPGLQASRPPWGPEYNHLAERLHALGLPPGGSEKVHHHALLHIYVNGLLSPVAANVGLDPAKHLESSLHTHDHTGVIHMESAYPYNFTLGDLFSVWGVKLGPAQVGALHGVGGDHLHFFLNGKTLANPAAHVLHDNDNISIGYGPLDSFPHKPGTIALKEVEGKGGAALSCAKASKGHKTRSCFATKP
ncbi:MAG: hypothetical protein H0X28_05190 [Solirubrobacterales bacterium]|nr:hypothetical protein [Solirubrobacterales bacterium]